MKRNTIIGVCAGMLVVMLTIVLWPKPNRGEFDSERGSIYFFSDGLVAIDTSRTPNEYYIYIDDPKVFKDVEIREDGLWVRGSGIEDGAEEWVGGQIHLGLSRPEAGKVRVIEDKGDVIDGRHYNINPKKIDEFVGKRDWDASVRQLLKE